MRNMKRFVIPALLAIGVALFAATLALAGGTGATWGPITYQNTGVEPKAAGTATATKVKFVLVLGGSPTEYCEEWTASLTETCIGLTPGATYTTINGAIYTADRYGNLNVTWKNGGLEYLWSDSTGQWLPTGDFGRVDIARVNPDGTETVVLRGSIPYGGSGPR
jgi:hypothetical protein